MKHVQYESLGTQHNDGMRLTDSLTIEHDCTSKHAAPAVQPVPVSSEFVTTRSTENDKAATRHVRSMA